jgi:hypothetical protein
MLVHTDPRILPQGGCKMRLISSVIISKSHLEVSYETQLHKEHFWLFESFPQLLLVQIASQLLSSLFPKSPGVITCSRLVIILLDQIYVKLRRGRGNRPTINCLSPPLLRLDFFHHTGLFKGQRLYDQTA